MRSKNIIVQPAIKPTVLLGNSLRVKLETYILSSMYLLCS